MAQVHQGLPGNGKRIIEADPFSLGKPMDFFLQTPMDYGEAWGGLGRLGEMEEFETLGFPGISAECGECAAAV